MIFKYFVKFKLDNNYRTRYIKAKSYKQATIKLLDDYKANKITFLEFQGDPLPSRQSTSVELVRKANEAKEKKRKGAFKYFQLTGKTIFEKM